ncbi:hypothetical protein [Xylocopilactobacillus apis]|uniref:Uncharacterized protein n=1 Tax=Xylocopilactobacillus apis TaxID=2932183 RepID=A0AAU9DG95_9LACO|nr:hypothetical protein [Xylocopilactobacillus apis]BDR55737.1 hypothetical protein KIMC2_02990 [Xylocopilactobacillus apis]
MNEVIELLREFKKDHSITVDSDDALLLDKVDALMKLADFLDKAEGKIDITDIHILPLSATGYSEYRVINDNESDNKSMWTEYGDGDLRLYDGDWLVRMK